MAIENFIPEVWSANLLLELQKNLVYGSVCNRDYEGDISQSGDTVHITGINDITVKDYKKNTDIEVEEAQDKNAGTLLVNKADYFAFKIDDVDARQAKGDLEGPFAANAGYQMADKVDKYLAGLMDKAVTAASTNIASTEQYEDAYKALVQASVTLDKNNVPRTGRWAVVSPEFYSMLVQDTRFIAGSETTTNTLYNGIVGNVTGFTILESNNVPVTSNKQSIITGAGNIATTLAQQISKVEATRIEKGFGDMIKGLDLYGGLVTRPTALAKITLTVGA